MTKNVLRLSLWRLQRRLVSHCQRQRRWATLSVLFECAMAACAFLFGGPSNRSKTLFRQCPLPTAIVPAASISTARQWHSNFSSKLQSCRHRRPWFALTRRPSQESFKHKFPLSSYGVANWRTSTPGAHLGSRAQKTQGYEPPVGLLAALRLACLCRHLLGPGAWHCRHAIGEDSPRVGVVYTYH